MPEQNILSGLSKVVAADPYVVTIAANGYLPQDVKAKDPNVQPAIEDAGSGLVKLTITAQENALVQWEVNFKKRGIDKRN